MKRLSEEQKEYLAFLPEAFESLNLNKYTKLLLAKLIQVHYSCGEQDYLYLGDREIKRDVNLRFEDINKARALAIQKGLIHFFKGVRHVASHYILCFNPSNGEVKNIDKSLIEQVKKIVEGKMHKNKDLEEKNTISTPKTEHNYNYNLNYNNNSNDNFNNNDNNNLNYNNKQTIEKENDLNSNNFNLKEKENDMENIIIKLDYTKKLQEVKTIEECKAFAREVYEQLQSLELGEPLLTEVKNRLHEDWVKRLNELQPVEEKKEEEKEEKTESPTLEEKALTLEDVLKKLEIIPMFEKVKTIDELKAKVGELLKTIPTLNLSHQLEVQVRNHIAYSILPKHYEKVKAFEALEERQRLETISVKVA